MDVQVHDVGVQVGLGAPHRVEDLLARHDLAGVADQVAEEREFARRELDAPIAGAGDVAELVELEQADGDARLDWTPRGVGRAP